MVVSRVIAAWRYHAVTLFTTRLDEMKPDFQSKDNKQARDYTSRKDYLLWDSVAHYGKYNFNRIEKVYSEKGLPNWET